MYSVAEGHGDAGSAAKRVRVEAGVDRGEVSQAVSDLSMLYDRTASRYLSSGDQAVGQETARGRIPHPGGEAGDGGVRVAELERQVRELERVVRRLQGRREGRDDDEVDADDDDETEAAAEKQKEVGLFKGRGVQTFFYGPSSLITIVAHVRVPRSLNLSPTTAISYSLYRQ